MVPRVARWSASSSAPTRPTDYATAPAHRRGRLRAFFHALLDRGVAIAPGAYEVLFPGLAHTDAVVDQIVDRAADAATATVAALGR